MVRTTAVEIRKRIAQYYHEEGHQNEIRIDFPAGSYLPEFRMPEKPAVLAEPVAPNRSETAFWRLGVVAAAAVLALAVVLLTRPWESQSAMDRFWAPVLSSAGSGFGLHRRLRHGNSPGEHDRSAELGESGLCRRHGFGASHFAAGVP